MAVLVLVLDCVRCRAVAPLDWLSHGAPFEYEYRSAEYEYEEPTSRPCSGFALDSYSYSASRYSYSYSIASVAARSLRWIGSVTALHSSTSTAPLSTSTRNRLHGLVRASRSTPTRTQHRGTRTRTRLRPLPRGRSAGLAQSRRSIR